MLRSTSVAPLLFIVVGASALVNACGSDQNPSTTGSSASAGGGTPGSTGSAPTNGTGGAGGSGPVDPNCPAEPSGPVPKLKLTKVAEGLSGPLFAIGAPKDETRLYIIEQPGRIRILDLTSGQLVPEPFLDVTAEVTCCGERGLLGLAFHPDYAQNGRFFINYTAPGGGPAGHTVVAEYARSKDPNKADTTETVIVTVDQPYTNHNGGMIAFGKDGYLYIGMGDGGDAGDPHGNGQDLAEKLGKMLRIDVDKYPAPAPGNLPVQKGSDPHIWSYGLRNPWRFSFDRCTGDLYISDVGQGAWEETNVAKNGEGHQNYGWKITEGTHCYPDSAPCDKTGITMPVTEYAQEPGSTGDCSVTGGYVYRGKKIPNLVGAYIYGDFCSGKVRTLVWKDGKVISEDTLTDDLQSKPLLENGLSSFGEDTAGEIYVTLLGQQAGDGEVYRIESE